MHTWTSARRLLQGLTLAALAVWSVAPTRAEERDDQRQGAAEKTLYVWAGDAFAYPARPHGIAMK
jgi:hypothetical protein